MMPKLRTTHRRFLDFTAATIGGILMSGAMGLGADPIAAESKAGETDHFWYRLQPPGPYIDSQRGNKAFGREEGAIVLSEDNGRTWPHSLAFPDARSVTFSHIFRNGNILFSTIQHPWSSPHL